MGEILKEGDATAFEERRVRAAEKAKEELSEALKTNTDTCRESSSYDANSDQNFRH